MTKQASSERQYIASLLPQTQVDAVFRIADRQLRSNRQGNPYLLLQLQDRSGVISAMRWNADEKLADRFPKGAFVKVQGMTQLHNGNMQIIVNQMQYVDADQVALEEFDALDRGQVKAHWETLCKLVETIADPTVSAICQEILADEPTRKLLQIAPAGTKTHHAYPGGLLEHIVSLMQLCEFASSHYTHVDRDLLMAAALVHDLGKIQELSFENELNYTDAGQLLGHLVQGVVMLESFAKRLRDKGQTINAQKLLRLEHIVVSHHGTLEHGSPKVPMTLEALVFHYLDEMDAKLNTATELISQDRSSDPWTPFHPTLSRRLYKASLDRQSNE
ncbi:MAG: 3'-5' exoribonuclease YhaM family protein [Planctomycetota bacterium]|jgi:3'-5' exoribonuclease